MRVNLMRKHRLFAIAIAFLLIIADQLTKEWILSIAHSVTRSPLLFEVTSFFNLVLVWNYGISFGMFPAQSIESTMLLIGATSVLSLILLIWLLRTPRPLTIYGLGTVIGGAIGNICDRLLHGAVVDFLDFHIHGYHWPAFNLADTVIFLGVVLLLVDSILEMRAESSNRQDKTIDA